MNELVDAMAHMREQEALSLAEKMLNEGVNPLKVLEHVPRGCGICRKTV